MIFITASTNTRAASLSVYISAPAVRSSEETFAGDTTFLGDLQTETFQSYDSAASYINYFTPSGPTNYLNSGSAMLNGGVYSATASNDAYVIGFDSAGSNNDPISPGGSASNFWDHVARYSGGRDSTGAASSDTNSYMRINNGSSVTIQFSTGINYFGFLWTAGDSFNEISLYGASNNLLATYSTADLIGFLQSSDIFSVTGESYDYADFLGKPGTENVTPTWSGSDGNANTRHNSEEPYTYIHLLDTGSTGLIHSVRLTTTSNSVGKYFESDNHSVAMLIPDLISSRIILVDSGIALPEPSKSLFSAAGALTLLLSRSRRKRD